MIRPIYERLSVGDEHGAGYATVHACKHPCHKEKCGQPKPGDPSYLSHAEGDHLYLNMIDPDKPLFQLPMFVEALRWMRDRHEEGKELLVHCNQGKSRSPSLAMLFLAKVLKVIPGGSYDEAVSEFVDLYPEYAPGMGIKLYMAEHWDRITIEEPAAKVSSFKRATIPDETNAYTLEEIDLIASDPELWGRLHGFIEDRETKQPIKFKPSPLQRRALAHYRRCRDTCRDCGVTTCSCPLDRRGVPVRIVMPKIRRGGGSTVAQLIMYVHGHNYVSRLATIGTSHKVSLNMFKMCRFFDKNDTFEHWPRATKILETGELTWPNGSSWEMYTAENPESARSAGLQGYHATEVGRWQDGGSTDARETLRSMLAAVPKRGFTVVIEESTAQGAQGAFYERFISARWPEYAQWWRTWEDEYQQQVEKIGAREQFVRIFAAWFEDDENKPDEPLTEEQIQHIQRTLTEKERALIDRYGNEGPQGMRLGTEAEVATLWQQLAWRRSVIKSEFSGDVQGFEQEYPSSPKEAFASSGRRTFNADGVQYMIEVAKSRRPRKGILTKQSDGQVAFYPTDDSGAWVQVWQEPRPGHSYLGYADVMTGAEQIKGSDLFDFHAAGILRADHLDEHGRRHPIEQVCSLIPESTVEHDILAWQTYLMSLWYGGCMIVPEINGPGHGYLSELRKLGANIYQRQSIDKITGMSTDRLGWVTDTNTRPAIITHMQTLMRNNADEGTRSAGIVVNCPYAAQQFSTIVKDAKGKDAAAPRTHDDEVLALCIGAYNIAQATRLPHRVRKRQKPVDLNHWKSVG